MERCGRRYAGPLDDKTSGIREHGVRLPVSVIRHIARAQASTLPPAAEDEDWWRTFNDDEGYPENYDGALPEGWWEARINEDWWKTASLDS
jgi:hypothetical protein